MAAKQVKGQPLDTSDWFRQDTGDFIAVWKKAVRAGDDWDAFLAALRKTFGNATGTDSSGNTWSNKGKALKPQSVEAKCRSINKQFAKHRRSLPVPGKNTGIDYGAEIEEDDGLFTKLPSSE